MRTHFFLLVFLLLVGCTPSTTDLSSAERAVELTTSSPSPLSSPTAAAPTQAQPLGLPPLTPSATPTKVLPSPTTPPSPTSTPAAVVFDRSGYTQFALLRQFYPFTLGPRFEQTFTPISHAFSPTGDLVATSACWGSMTNSSRCESQSSGLLFVFNPHTAELVVEIPLAGFWPGGLDFTSDGRALLYATTEQRVALWDLQSNAPGLILYQTAYDRNNSYPAVAAAPDGTSYAAVVIDTLYVWNADGSLRFQAPASGLLNGYAALTYSADASRLLALASNAAALNVFETASGTVLRTIPATFTDAHLSLDGRSVAAVDWHTGSGQIWDVDSGTRLAIITTAHRAESVAFNPAGDLLVISGLGNLETPDSYSYLATVIDTRTWATLGELYSAGAPGQVSFNKDGSLVAFLDDYQPGIYGLPDDTLGAALESARRFQAALFAGDYAAAAALFQPDEINREYLVEQGFDFSDLPATFASLCASQELACQPLLEAVMLGYDYDGIFILARLQAPDGSVFTTPEGGTLFYFFLAPGNPPVLITLPFE